MLVKWGSPLSGVTVPFRASPCGNSVRYLPLLPGKHIFLCTPEAPSLGLCYCLAQSTLHYIPMSLKAQACTPNPTLLGTRALAAHLSASDPTYLQKEQDIISSDSYQGALLALSQMERLT